MSLTAAAGAAVADAAFEANSKSGNNKSSRSNNDSCSNEKLKANIEVADKIMANHVMNWVGKVGK